MRGAQDAFMNAPETVFVTVRPWDARARRDGRAKIAVRKFAARSTADAVDMECVRMIGAIVIFCGLVMTVQWEAVSTTVRGKEIVERACASVSIRVFELVLYDHKSLTHMNR